METYLKTERTTPLRYPDRASYDADVVNPILDEALVCHVGFAGPDGAPGCCPPCTCVSATRSTCTVRPAAAPDSRPGRAICRCA